jgi:hypothetical protein
MAKALPAVSHQAAMTAWTRLLACAALSVILDEQV